MQKESPGAAPRGLVTRMSYPKAQIWQRGSRKRPDPPKVSDGPWPFVSQRTRVLAQLRARTVQMGSSVATWLGTGADYSGGCPRAALSSRDQSATDPQSQARQRAA